MNTPAHVIAGAAAFARPGAVAVNIAAVLRSLMPDISLYVLAGTAIFLMDVPPDAVFDEFYFSDSWQQVFAVDNSFVVWGSLLGIARWRRSPVLTAFAGAALLHLALDFPLHHDDARPHFWPLTDWVFVSPVSYWDRRHFGDFVGPLEAVLCITLCAALLMRFRDWRSRLLVLALGALQVVPVFIWVFIFEA
jgi:membrane-bound metal-dependent hydrolase YbcI (DUF457 family)